MSVLFGVAGNSDTFTETVSKASADAPAWLRAIGLDAYEYQCGKGVRVGEATARQIGKNAAQAGIRLSLHAPYFISLANPDPETVKKSIGYVTASCRAAQWMGADRVILHSGALMKRTRREALDIAKANLKAILAACAEQGFEDVTLCPETMGKINQLGDLTEVLELCQVDERLVPCVDFGHLYARSLGALDGADACKAMLAKWQTHWGRSGRLGSTATSPRSPSPPKAASRSTCASPMRAGGRSSGRWRRRSPDVGGALPLFVNHPAPRARMP